MRLHLRGSWAETRHELGQFLWAVALIDVIAIGLGVLAARPMGSFAIKVGVGLAIFATVVFALFVGASLGVEWMANWWVTRHHRR